jgi:aspartate racemase
MPKTLRNIEAVNFLAAREFVPSVYAGRVTLFWASGDLTTSFDLVDGWHTLAAGGVELRKIPGSHINQLKAPHVQALADELRACLDQAQKKQLPGVRAA